MTAVIQSDNRTGTDIETSGGANQTSATLTAPSGIVDGDLLLIIFHIDGKPTITPPSGFATEIISNGQNDTLAVYTKVASSESGDYALTFASQKWGGYIARIDNDNGVDVSGKDDNASSTTSDAPSVTTTVDDCLVFRAWTLGGERTPFTPDVSTTELYDDKTVGAGSVSFAAATETQVSSGATGIATVTASSAALAEAVTIAIAPSTTITQEMEILII